MKASWILSFYPWTLCPGFSVLVLVLMNHVTHKRCAQKPFGSSGFLSCSRPHTGTSNPPAQRSSPPAGVRCQSSPASLENLRKTKIFHWISQLSTLKQNKQKKTLAHDSLDGWWLYFGSTWNFKNQHMKKACLQVCLSGLMVWVLGSAWFPKIPSSKEMFFKVQNFLYI